MTVRAPPLPAKGEGAASAAVPLPVAVPRGTRLPFADALYFQMSRMCGSTFLPNQSRASILIRPAAEIDRQHPVDMGRPPPLAGDSALVELQQCRADPGLQREHRLPRILCQRLLRLLV